MSRRPVAAAGEEARQSDDEEALAGNPIRPRGLLLLFGGMVLGVAAMAAPIAQPTMVLVGALAAALASFGALDLLGSFDDEGDEPAPWRRLARPGLVVVLAAVVGVLGLRAAVAGTVSPHAAGALLTVAALALLGGGFLFAEAMGPCARDEAGALRPLHRRHGFWLLALAAVLQLPYLGSHTLVDPWEPHYAEVSREILARGDWISLWWAEDGWFWSKPVLTFWLQAIAMAVAGVRFEPGRMLEGIASGREPCPEWAVRMPCFVLTLLGLYLLYRGMVHAAGRRAAFLGGVVLLTMPQFSFVAHQAMTDMPFVACLMATSGLLLSAYAAPASARARSYALPLLPDVRVTLFHLVVGAVAAVVVAQAMYLLSRNLLIKTDPYFDLRFVHDSFLQGSAGNCGLPGNAECKAGMAPVVPRVQPALQALIWLQGLAFFLWLSWGERRLKRLLYLAAWLFAALAVLAKGVAGLGLPMLAAFAWVAATRRWRELARMEIAGGLLIVATVAMPWFIAMYVRHGYLFIERLLLEHMMRRAFGELHQTNEGDDVSFRYYVWQLGYATFPWVGLVPAALVSWLSRVERRARWEACAYLGALFLIGFALFALMGTKFHHYCLPIVPAAAMLVGVMLDDMVEERASTWAAVAMGAAILTALVGVDLAWNYPERPSAIRLLQLFTYKYTRAWPATLDFGSALGAFTAMSVAVTLALAIRSMRARAIELLAVVAIVFTVWSLDVYLMQVAPHWGQRALLARYERERLAQPGELIAYQLNWKGENFYRGNALATFKVSGAKFQDYVDERKRQGERTFYFITEQKRVDSLKGELGLPRVFERLTDERDNNKFQLVRAHFGP
jgi:4-amino-4-deoxy-L-arabinose transferase-like glycosyltransferase